jgi:hypothetical protein
MALDNADFEFKDGCVALSSMRRMKAELKALRSTPSVLRLVTMLDGLVRALAAGAWIAAVRLLVYFNWHTFLQDGFDVYDYSIICVEQLRQLFEALIDSVQPASSQATKLSRLRALIHGRIENALAMLRCRRMQQNELVGDVFTSLFGR